jgi:hypothetical protein
MLTQVLILQFPRRHKIPDGPEELCFQLVILSYTCVFVFSCMDARSLQSDTSAKLNVAYFTCQIMDLILCF